jgi:tetratricopeptide (TPR) repeat protein
MKAYRTAAIVVFAGMVAAEALAVSPKQPPACVVGAEALAQKQPELAVTEYNKCLSSHPPTFEILSNLGMAYAQLKQFPNAIQTYVQALALNPDSARVRMNLGLAYLKTGHPKRASKQFARSLMTDPHNAKTLELLAYCHYQMRDFELAGYEAGLVHKAVPGDPSSEFLLGSSYLQLGMFRRAIPLIYDSVSKSKSPGAYMVLGEAFLGVKAWRQALESFQKAVSLDPNMPGIYADLGTAYEGVGQPDKAMVALKKELARDPNDFEANYLLGRTDRINGDDADALKYLGRAEKLHPGDASVAYEYAVLAMQHQDYAKAESILRGILQKLPGYTDAHVLLAEVYFRMHKNQEGMREKAIVAALKDAQHARTVAEGQALSQESSKGVTTPARQDP